MFFLKKVKWFLFSLTSVCCVYKKIITLKDVAPLQILSNMSIQKLSCIFIYFKTNLKWERIIKLHVLLIHGLNCTNFVKRKTDKLLYLIKLHLDLVCVYVCVCVCAYVFFFSPVHWDFNSYLIKLHLDLICVCVFSFFPQSIEILVFGQKATKLNSKL